MDELECTPVGLETFVENMWNIPDIPHPDDDWRDPEEHAHFGKDAVDFVYRTWEDELGSRWETLHFIGELMFKVGPIKNDEDDPEITCDKVMELLTDIEVKAKDNSWMDQKVYRLEQTIQPGEWASDEALFFDEDVVITTRQTADEHRRDAPVITCSKVFDLMRLVFENTKDKIPVTFVYVYEGAPRKGTFASNDFAA